MVEIRRGRQGDVSLDPTRALIQQNSVTVVKTAAFLAYADLSRGIIAE